MFGFLSRRKKKRKAVVYTRAMHCISRENIDRAALDVINALTEAGYTAYLVGGGVRDLLLKRSPKDFDVGTSATPAQVQKVIRQRLGRCGYRCILVGRRFPLALVRRGGDTLIETATFRQNSQTAAEIKEHAAEGPFKDNTYGTPETDAFRRDFTVNGLFYSPDRGDGDPRDGYPVIDWVGGMEDLNARVIRSIGDPMIRFREDPVRMMRAIKFAARLDFTIEPKTDKAIRKLHAFISTAAVPRLCEEVFRLFPYGESEKAFRMMYDYGLLGDLLPELAAFITADGGAESSTWKYLAALDVHERAKAAAGGDVSNAVRAAVLLTAMTRAAEARPAKKAAAATSPLELMARALNMPRHAVTTPAQRLLQSSRRILSKPGDAQKARAFILSLVERPRRRRFGRRGEEAAPRLDWARFADALDYNRIVARAEGRDGKTIDQWDAVSRKVFKEQGEKNERTEEDCED